MRTDTVKWIEIYYKVLNIINCQQINYWVYRGSTPKRRMVQKSTKQTHSIPSHPSIKQEEINPRGHRGIPLPCASCWFNDAHCAQLTPIWTSSTYRKEDAKMPTILRLRSITRGRNRHISSKQHETCDTQWCIVPIRTQGPQQSRRSHVHGRHWGHSHQQWSGTQHIADDKSSDVIGHRTQTWRIVHQVQNGSLHATHSWGNGTSTNLHPHTNQQLDCPHTTHQQNYAQGFEGHGHAIPLVALPQSTGPVLE